MMHRLFLLSFSLKTAFLCVLGFEFRECCKLSFACTVCGHTIHWRRRSYSIIKGVYSQGFKPLSLARNIHFFKFIAIRGANISFYILSTTVYYSCGLSGYELIGYKIPKSIFFVTHFELQRDIRALL
jgi:hypothetical protein